MFNQDGTRNCETLIELSYMPPARRTYLLDYYSRALPAVFRRHRLNLPFSDRTYRVVFSLSEAEQQAWRTLFGLEGDQRERVPLTYASSAATPAFMHLLSSLGINFKYLRHVASEIDFLSTEAVFTAGASYTYMASLRDVVAVGRGRVVLELGSSVFGPEDRLRSVHTDYFMVSGFREAQLEALGASANLHKVARFEQISAYTRQLGGTPHIVTIPRAMGVRYGQLSGDMNIVHTTGLAARLMGFPRPFIQGLCTVNLLLSRLLPQPGTVTRRFSCTFTRPVFVAEALALHYDGERYELLNEAGKVVAYGACYQAQKAADGDVRERN